MSNEDLVKELQNDNEFLKNEVSKFRKYWEESEKRCAEYVQYKNAFVCLLEDLS